MLEKKSGQILGLLHTSHQTIFLVLFSSDSRPISAPPAAKIFRNPTHGFWVMDIKVK